MRKELTRIFKSKKTIKKAFWISFLVAFFILTNGFVIYFFNPNNYYFFLIKKIIPYPAFVVGNRMISFSYFDDKISAGKKIYEIAYRVNFISGADGKKNLETLKENTKNEIIDRIVMEGLLGGQGIKIGNNEVKEEYKNIIKNVGDDKEILNILKYSSGLRDSDIKDSIYQNLLKEKIKNDFVYNLKMKAIVIKPENMDIKEDWDGAHQKALDIYNDIASNKGGFDQYQTLYGDKNDPIAQNLWRDYYFGEELPKELQDKFYDLEVGKVNQPIKGEGGYYIFNVYEKRGYFKGSYNDFMKAQLKRVRIISFLR